MHQTARLQRCFSCATKGEVSTWTGPRTKITHVLSLAWHLCQGEVTGLYFDAA